MKILTNDEAVELMHCVHRDFEEFLRRLNRRLQTSPESLTPQATFLAQQYEEVYRALNNNEAWKAYKFLDSESFTAVLKEYQKLCRNFCLNAFAQFPLEEFKVSEEGDEIPIALEKSLELLKRHGNQNVQDGIKEYMNARRLIEFERLDNHTLGETHFSSGYKTHIISSELAECTAENQVRLTVTLAHEMQRTAESGAIEAETQEIVLEDTKLVESLAAEYGEDLYKKFPEYGILHCIKKIFGETELKDFVDYAFDSNRSYWKVNADGSLTDDGNISQVVDSSGRIIHSGNKGMQGTLETWLDMNNVFTALMKPAGYEWNATEKKWAKNPGKIDRSIIESAYKEGMVTEDQYRMIQLAAGRNEAKGKFGLFKQILRDYQKASLIHTQIRTDLVNRAWEWVKGKYKKTTGISEKTDLFNQLDRKYEKVKKVKYSNDLADITYDEKYIPLESSEYFNCISFVCYMYDVPASYSVKNFDKYTQFKELKNVTDVSQLQIGDVITWEYESGTVDGDGNPIYEYHASIWKGNGEIWECMDPKGVRHREYNPYYKYMNTNNKTIHVVKYFRYKGEQNAKM